MEISHSTFFSSLKVNTIGDISSYSLLQSQGIQDGRYLILQSSPVSRWLEQRYLIFYSSVSRYTRSEISLPTVFSSLKVYKIRDISFYSLLQSQGIIDQIYLFLQSSPVSIYTKSVISHPIFSSLKVYKIGDIPMYSLLQSQGMRYLIQRSSPVSRYTRSEISHPKVFYSLKVYTIRNISSYSLLQSKGIHDQRCILLAAHNRLIINPASDA